METRSLEAYTAVMTYHRHLIGDDAELTRLIMDFEAAEMRAGEEIFQCRVTGCMWHLIRVSVILLPFHSSCSVSVHIV